jgi:hypothetical protein
VQYASIFEYLKPMKDKLDGVSTQNELDLLLAEVGELDEENTSQVLPVV